MAGLMGLVLGEGSLSIPIAGASEQPASQPGLPGPLLFARHFFSRPLMVFLRKGSRVSKTLVRCSGRKGGQRRDQGPGDHGADIFAPGF